MKIMKLPLDNKVVADASYIKLCQNKTHMGPVSLDKIEARKASKLSTAANKVRVQSNLTLSHSTGDNKKKVSSGNQSYVIAQAANSSEITELGVLGVLTFEAWAEMFNVPGTKEYMSAFSAFTKAKGSCYASMGINPTGEKKPKLSEDQRAVYNQEVGPYGFTYYEYHLAFKIEGDKSFTRTKTYRSLKPLSIDTILKKLQEKVDSSALNGRIKAKVVAGTYSGPEGSI